MTETDKKKANFSDAPPPNPVADFEDFFKTFEDAPDHVKYRQKISDAYAKSEKFIEILFDDILLFDPCLANYLKNQPIRAISDAEDAFKNILRIDSGGTLNPDDDFIVKIGSKTDMMLEKIDKISHEKIDKLVQVDVEIMGIMPPYNIYKILTVECSVCGNLMQEPQFALNELIYPKECSNPNCKNNKGFRILNADSQFTRIQIGQVRDIEKRTNSTLKILIPEYLVGSLHIGDQSKIFGIYQNELIENKGKQKNRSIPRLLINNIETHGQQPHQQILTDSSRIYLEPRDGIYLDEFKENDPKTEILFGWKKFHIDTRFKHLEGNIDVWKYFGYISTFNATHFFENADISDIKIILQKNCAVSGKNINFCTMPLQSFLGMFPDSTDKFTDILGFTETGWKLPHNCLFIPEDEYAKDVWNNLKKLKESYNIEQQIKSLQNFYELTGIKYKQLIFQWAIMSPFSHVFRKIFRIMPGLALRGKPQTGKSGLLEIIMKEWFGHYLYVINSSDANSAARLEGVMATSTLMIFIDECTNLHGDLVDIVKSHFTNEGQFTRKGEGKGKQFASIKKPKVSAVALNCNDSPEWFNDDAFLQRILIGDVDYCDQKDGWEDAVKKLERGSILRILYERTKNWKIEDLEVFSKAIKVPDEFKKDKRAKAFYLFFACGMRMLKAFFNIDTNMDDLESLLTTTRQNNAETLLAIMEYHVRNARLICNVEENGTMDYYTESEKKYHLPVHHWIKTPIYDSHDGLYWAWTTNNIRELQTFYEGNMPKRWSLQSFLAKVQNYMPNCEKKNATLRHLETTQKNKNWKEWCVLIPKTQFNIDDKSRESEPKTEIKQEKKTETINTGACNRNRFNVILSKLKEMLKIHDSIKIDDIAEPLSIIDGITKDLIIQCINEWVRDGTLYSPSDGKYKFSNKIK